MGKSYGIQLINMQNRFTNVIESFIKVGVDWGKLYNKYSSNIYNPNELETEVSKLMMDDEVENKKGIYEYVFDGLERHLNLRAFTESEKTTMYERQHGICPLCNNHFDYSQMQGDHITPWSQGGKTTLDNGQMLYADCNRRKSSR